MEASNYSVGSRLENRASDSGNWMSLALYTRVRLYD